MSAPVNIVEALVRALRSTPCRCGADSIDRPPEKRTQITCGRCSSLKAYDAHIDSKVVIASHAGDD